jgi:hypothetical protein
VKKSLFHEDFDALTLLTPLKSIEKFPRRAAHTHTAAAVPVHLFFFQLILKRQKRQYSQSHCRAGTSE